MLPEGGLRDEMDTWSLAAREIIKAQELVIGPIAFEQARKISGLKIPDLNQVQITGNPKQILTDLVHKYEQFFGRASVEVCKDAVRGMRPSINSQDLPDILK